MEQQGIELVCPWEPGILSDGLTAAPGLTSVMLASTTPGRFQAMVLPMPLMAAAEWQCEKSGLAAGQTWA